MDQEVQQVEQQTNGAVVEGAEQTQSVEREARSMGWVPETEWKGEPPRSGFKSAEDFVKRGNEVLPIVNKRLKEENAALSDRLEKLERETSDQIERMGKMSKVALDRQRQQIEDKYEALKESAVETGDKAAYKEADKAAKDALADFDKAASEPEIKDKDGKLEIPPSVKKTIDGWVSENDWFKTDEEMNAVANARHAKLLKEKPGLSLADNLADVRAYVQKRFPEKFAEDDEGDESEERPRRGSPVEGGSRVNGSGSPKSSWSRVPAADKAMAENAGHIELFLEKGETLEKDGPKAKERWAKEYFKGEQL